MSVLLGLPGDLVADSNCLSPAEWRIGGRASFPERIAQALGPLTCSHCTDELPLVAQVSDRSAEPHTSYLLFGCTRIGCGREQGSWRAFAFPFSAIPEAVNKVSQLPAQQKSEAPETNALQWGADALDWGSASTENGYSASAQADQQWGDEASNVVSTSQLQAEASPGESSTALASKPIAPERQDHGFDSLLDQLQSAMTLKDEPPSKKQIEKRQEQNCRSGAAYDWQAQPCSRELPAFHLHEAAEPLYTPLSGDKEAQHIQDLLQKYQQEESSFHQAAANQASAAESGNSWTGEKYEKAAVKAVDSSFMKFTKRVKREPDQCLRLGGELLWPSKNLPAGLLETCKFCSGSPRVVMQLMPAVMPVLEEAAQWLQQARPDPSEKCLIDWEWTTIVVYGCEKRCKRHEVQELIVAIASE